MMTHKLKALGVALFAALALTAVSASASSASSYTASTYPTTGTGTSPLGNNVLTTEAGKVECAVHYEGTLTKASEDLTMTERYTGCKAFGFLEAKMSNCTYTYTTPVPWKGNHLAKVDVVGSPCTITAGTCAVSVLTQGGLGSVQLINY